ncbi:MAG: NAD(P)/FAD-dependent oxidoreductase [Frankiales bacterium]|nr:NAD(P)/FAD-dependent oxidoreductase [Frankiales bacterium]
MTPSFDVDALVVGAGPAGLSAALWLGRYRRTVLVLDSGEHRNAATQRVHGYLGLDDLSPADLTKRGETQLASYPTIEIRKERACAVEGTLGDFRVSLDGGSTVRAARLLLSTGVADVLPVLRNFGEHYGRSAFHCPACDGYEAQGLDVVALGWDERLAGFAGMLLTWARSVTVVTDGFTFTGDEAARAAMARHGIEVVEQAAVEFCGKPGQLHAVRLANGREVPAQMVFFSYGHQPRADLAASLGCELDDEGYVVVDRDGCTTVDGVFAAGDLTAGYQLVQRAASSGTVAGVSAALSLTGEQPAPTAPAVAPDIMREAEELRAGERTRD